MHTLLEELLLAAVRDGDVRVNISFEAEDLVKIVNGKCYEILSEIQKIVRDDSLDDPECFKKVEEIICLFEREGLRAGSRHDF
ncbi:MAG: hypothetical protein IJ519_02950 [Clostridia bacterium]|nr:hypothetical protein [Clostridia bacterium]